MSLLAFFCDVDDFCQSFRARVAATVTRRRASVRQRTTGLVSSEIMTLLMYFCQSRDRDCEI